MIGIFGHQNLSDGCLGRHSALDQTARSLGLHDAVLAGATGVFGTPGDTPNCAGPISSRSLLSSPIRCSSPWQQGQVLSSMSTMTSIRGRCGGAAIVAALARPFRPAFRGGLALAGFRTSRNLLDVFETEQHLLLGKRLCFPGKATTLQLLDDLAQPLALVPLGKQHRLQRLGIIRKIIAHTQIRVYSCPPGDVLDAPDSLRRSAAHKLSGLRRDHRLPCRVDTPPIKPFAIIATSAPRPTRIVTPSASISMPPTSGSALRGPVLRSWPTATTGAMVSTTAGTNGGSSAIGVGCRRVCRRQVTLVVGSAGVAGQSRKRRRLVSASPRRSGPCRPWRTNDGAPSP
jgi:hypothetical protein